MNFEERRYMRGTALAPLIMISFFCLAAVLVYGARLMSEKSRVEQMEKVSKADCLANSAVADCLAKFQADRTYGTHGEFLADVMPYPEDSGAGYNLTFKTDAPVALRSVNNIGQDTPVYEGKLGTPVLCPAGCLRLVGVGTYRNYTRKVEVIFAAPPFNSAIASAGSVSSPSGMILGTVPKGFDPKTQTLDPLKLLPSQMQAAGTLTFSDRFPSTIVGNAKSGGAVNKGLANILQGSIQGNTQVDAIPAIDLSNVDFTGKAGVQTLPRSSFTGTEKLSGLLQWTGGTLSFDKLQLNGAVVRIHGNLSVTGGIEGAGAVIVDGNVTVNGASSLSADNQAAIVANGDVRIQGTGTVDNSFFQGLIYSKGAGGVSVANSTVLGTVISARAEAPTVLDNAKVVFNPTTVSSSYALGWSGGAPNFSVSVGIPGGGTASAHLVLAPKLLDNGTMGTPSPAWFLAHNQTALTAADFVLVDGSGKQLPDQSGMGAYLNTSGVKSLESELAALQTTTGLETGSFKLDLNQFLKASGSLHIVSKRNYN